MSQHLPPAGEPHARPVAEEGGPAPVVVVAPSMGKLSVSPVGKLNKGEQLLLDLTCSGPFELLTGTLILIS